jgi:hypothetical protein
MQHLVHLGKEVVKKSDSDRAPFNNYVVVSSEQWHYLHIRLSLDLRIPLVLGQSSLGVFGFECQKASVDQQTTVSVFRKTR